MIYKIINHPSTPILKKKVGYLLQLAIKIDYSTGYAQKKTRQTLNVYPFFLTDLKDTYCYRLALSIGTLKLLIFLSIIRCPYGAVREVTSDYGAQLPSWFLLHDFFGLLSYVPWQPQKLLNTPAKSECRANKRHKCHNPPEL